MLIEEFTTKILKEGVAKKCLYEVDFSGLNGVSALNGVDTTFLGSLVQSVAIPGRRFEGTDYNDWNRKFQTVTGYTDENLTMEFIVLGKEAEPMGTFQKWMSGIVNTDSATIAYRDDYVLGRMPISILSLDKNQQIFKVICEDVYPIATSAMTLGATNGETVLMSVEFDIARVKYVSSGTSHSIGDINLPTRAFV